MYISKVEKNPTYLSESITKYKTPNISDNNPNIAVTFRRLLTTIQSSYQSTSVPLQRCVEFRLFPSNHGNPVMNGRDDLDDWIAHCGDELPPLCLPSSTSTDASHTWKTDGQTRVLKYTTFTQTSIRRHTNITNTCTKSRIGTLDTCSFAVPFVNIHARMSFENVEIYIHPFLTLQKQIFYVGWCLMYLCLQV